MNNERRVFDRLSEGELSPNACLECWPWEQAKGKSSEDKPGQRQVGWVQCVPGTRERLIWQEWRSGAGGPVGGRASEPV